MSSANFFCQIVVLDVVNGCPMRISASTRVTTLGAALSAMTVGVPALAQGFSPEQLADDTCTMMRDSAVPKSIKTQTKQNVDQILSEKNSRSDYKQIQRGYQLSRARGCV